MLVFGLIFLISISESLAQRDSTFRASRNLVEKTRTSYVPTGIRVGTDLFSFVRIAIPDGFSGWEVYTDVDFNRFFFVLEAGYWERIKVSSSQDYQSAGYYFRLGANVSISKKRLDLRSYYLGLRYGYSMFSERLTYSIDDPSFGAIRYTAIGPSLTAGWVEVVAGVQVRVWKGIWMGMTGRIKFAPSISPHDQIQPFEVPGFGEVANMFSWGFNYQLSWRFSFKKEKHDGTKHR